MEKYTQGKQRLGTKWNKMRQVVLLITIIQFIWSVRLITLSTFPFATHSTFRQESTKSIKTLALITVLMVLHQLLHFEWFATKHYFGAIYISLICQFVNLWAFVVVATTEPGVIQKIVSNSWKYPYGSTVLLDSSFLQFKIRHYLVDLPTPIFILTTQQNYSFDIDPKLEQIPRNQHILNHSDVQHLIVGPSAVLKTKLCMTCNIYRPSRSSHCSDCGVCIERLDHHCPWLGTCIGKKNYRQFYVFILSLFVLLLTTIVMCIILMGANEGNLGETLKQYPFSIILLILCLPATIFVGILVAFHTYLILYNVTTMEFFKKRWTTGHNPYQKASCVKNLLKVIFPPSRREILFRYQKQQKDEATSDKNSSNQKPDETITHLKATNIEPPQQPKRPVKIQNSQREDLPAPVNTRPILMDPKAKREVRFSSRLPEIGQKQAPRSQNRIKAQASLRTSSEFKSMNDSYEVKSKQHIPSKHKDIAEAVPTKDSIDAKIKDPAEKQPHLDE